MNRSPAERRGIPEWKCLSQGLAAAVEELGGDPGRVVARDWNIYSSDAASEIVTCRFGEGNTKKLLCKYGNEYVDRRTGHRRGVPYEVFVYQTVLPELSLNRPKLFGAHEAELTWLVVDYLEGAERLDKCSNPGAVCHAAEELGRLHRQGEKKFQLRNCRLNCFGGSYMERWARRMDTVIGRWGATHSWMGGLTDVRSGLVECLSNAAVTTIHGEAYPQNILLREDRAILIDWESAGIGAGEIDLAAVLLDWPKMEGQEAVRRYRIARWGNAAPRAFQRVLLAGRIYMLIQVLDHNLRHGRRRLAEDHWVFASLREAANQFGRFA